MLLELLCEDVRQATNLLGYAFRQSSVGWSERTPTIT